ncbi:MAG: TldD/PmbA family protein [bacterium]|jgi:TldD protein|nr:TldD/PmbA family protein [bacterium]
MKDMLLLALDAALGAGADWADLRIIHTRRQVVRTRNGELAGLTDSEDLGFGIRVLAGGAWGFASSNRLEPAELKAKAVEAVRIARASAGLNKERVRLAPEPAWRDFWQTPLQIDPFTVDLSEKLRILHACDRILRADPRIKEAAGSMSFLREHQHYANSEGALIEQRLVRSGAGYTATAVQEGEAQERSYPMSHGGQYMGLGWELILALDLPGHAERVREEAIALLTAPVCPAGRLDLILLPQQMVLQIHESVGHASELDRVLGYEANYAGTSFATVDKLGHFRYGSPLVNLVADGTVPGGLATQGYDDDGVRQQRWPIVQEGILTGYMTNRELAHRVEEPASRGCNRAEGWFHLPITRINNLSLMPGAGTLEELIGGVEDGVMMDANKCWSIDQQRLNFQFGCEIGWRIRRGKLAGIVKNPTYQGITPEFWGACDGICGPEEWKLVGVANCGKGQPGQTAEMSHGSSPTRFRGIQVGV